MKNLLFGLLLALAACSSGRVQYAHQPANVDFKAYKTYNFLDVTARNETPIPRPGTGIMALKQAISREMERRGYRQADQPDLWVNIGVVTRDTVQTRPTNYLQDAPRYIGQRTYHWQSQDVVVGHYEEGTATVEVVDAARKELIWDGAVSSVLTPDTDKLTRRIDGAIATLFKKYPVPPQQ